METLIQLVAGKKLVAKVLVSRVVESYSATDFVFSVSEKCQKVESDLQCFDLIFISCR